MAQILTPAGASEIHFQGDDRGLSVSCRELPESMAPVLSS